MLDAEETKRLADLAARTEAREARLRALGYAEPTEEDRERVRFVELDMARSGAGEAGVMRFWVPGPLPGLNEMLDAAKGCGGRGLAYSAMKAKWTGDISLIARAARIPKMTRIRLRFDWVSFDKRHNPDNIEAAQKFIWDALCPKAKGKAGADVIENDGWDQNAGSEHHHSVGPKPGVWVTVIDASEPSRHLTPVVTRRLAPLADGTYRGRTPKE